MKVFLNIFVVFALVCCAGFSYAQAYTPSMHELMQEIRGMKERIVRLEGEVAELKAANIKNQKDEEKAGGGESENTKVGVSAGGQGASKEPFKDILWGIDLNAAVFAAGQAAFDVNNTSEDNTDETGGQYAAHIFLSKQFTENGKGLIHIEAGDGLALHRELELFSGINNDMDYTDNSVEVAELWYEQELFDGQLVLTGGKLDTSLYVDQSDIAGSYEKHFLCETFFRAPTIDFPSNDKRSPGIRMLLQPGEQPWYQVEAQIANGRGTWDNLLEYYFSSVQLSFAPDIFGYTKGKYRIYGWARKAHYRKWADPNTKADQKFGFGASTLQSINDWMDFTFKYGWADPGIYDMDNFTLSGRQFSLEHTFAAGLQVRGKPWGRENDHIGIAAGLNFPSDKYRKASPGRRADTEGHAEFYYSYFVNPYVRISPDLQFVWNPFGNDVVTSDKRRKGFITVVGVRSAVAF